MESILRSIHQAHAFGRVMNKPLGLLRRVK
jgi:hypothetical protein